MKITLNDRRPVAGQEGHAVRELIGLASMNVPKYSVAHIRAEAGSQGTERQNQFDEIVIVIDGHGTVEQEHVRHEVGPKDVVLLPAGTRYTIHAAPGEALEFWALCVPAFRPEWSNTGPAKRDWRDYQVPRGADRLREIRGRDE